jgi:hypothetical protein
VFVALPETRSLRYASDRLLDRSAALKRFAGDRSGTAWAMSKKRRRSWAQQKASVIPSCTPRRQWSCEPPHEAAIAIQQRNRVAPRPGAQVKATAPAGPSR